MKNAKEVLIDFVKNDNVDPWIATVILSYIYCNGKVNEEKKIELVNLIFNLEKKDNEIDEFKQDILIINKDQNKVKLNEIEHIEGVSALAKNQIIKFSEDMTFIYGLNGTGKSSYYKILYNMINNNDKKTIYSNVYENDEAKKIQAKIKYNINGQEEECCYGDDVIKNLNNIRFFDSEIAAKSLLRKSPDELLLKPFELNLFSEIISIVDELVDMAKEMVSNEKKSLAQNNAVELIENYKAISNCEGENEIKGKVYSVFDKNIDELTKEYEEIETQKNRLEQEYVKDNIELFTIKLEELKKTNEKINNKNNLYEKYIKLKSEISNIKNELNNKKEQIKIINNIPNSDTDDWKKFIKYGLEKQNDFHGKCPFCQRDYDSASINIIRAYIKYLNDNLEAKYSEFGKELANIESSLLSINISESEGVKYVDECIKQRINKWEERINTKIEQNDNYVQESIDNDILIGIGDMIKYYKDEICKLMKTKDEKAKEIELLNEKLRVLNAEISIINEKDKICKYYDGIDRIKFMEGRTNSINTTKITNLSKKTHNDLLSDSFKKVFQNNLEKILGNSRIQFELKTYSTKGNNQMELFIKDKNIVEILSEGEQKAVSLALFLSEIELSSNSSPLIFDDPVNSMDNRIADNFANVLLRTNNQIVVFSHNLLFFESLQTSPEGHICKTYDISCNKNSNKFGKHKKHIMVYKTEDNGVYEKGIIIQYKKDDAKQHIETIKAYLNYDPFDKIEECSLFVRKAVECIVDEMIFNNQVPTKFSNKNNRIHWDELKNIGTDSETIDKLRRIHDRCSGAAMHNGFEQTNNPLTKQEISDMCNELGSILNSNTSNE